MKAYAGQRERMRFQSKRGTNAYAEQRETQWDNVTDSVSSSPMRGLGLS